MTKAAQQNKMVLQTKSMKKRQKESERQGLVKVSK